MTRSWRWLWQSAAVAVAVALLWLMLRGRRSASTAVASSASASASTAAPAPSFGPPVALLGGLRVGDALEEWKVTRLVVNESVEKKPQLAIELERRGSGITIWVARKGNAKNPALSTELYDFTFGHARPYGDPIPDGAYLRMLTLVMERVRAAEKTAAPPEGL